MSVANHAAGYTILSTETLKEMETLKILVVEDEPIIATDIEATLMHLGYEVPEAVASGEEALDVLKSERVDLVLMDINLEGELDGIQTAHIINEKFPMPIIYLTANTDPSTFKRARHTHPYAFLPKPFDKHDLQRSIDLAFTLIKSQAEEREEGTSTEPEVESPGFVLKDRIFVKTRDRMIKIFLKDIYYIQAEGNYCHIHTPEKKHLVLGNLKSFERKLVDPEFIRVHRSYIINLQLLEELGEVLLKVGNHEVPVSKSYKDDLMQKLRLI